MRIKYTVYRFITPDKRNKPLRLSAPILEPSTECSECQYFEKCFMKKKNSKHVDIGEMLGIGKFGGKN